MSSKADLILGKMASDLSFMMGRNRPIARALKGETLLADGYKYFFDGLPARGKMYYKARKYERIMAGKIYVYKLPEDHFKALSIQWRRGRTPKEKEANILSYCKYIHDNFAVR